MPLPATVLPVVEIVADMVTPGPVSVKVKVPLPPVVFLVTTTEPRALLRNEGVQGVEPAPVTTAVHVVNPTGTKSALAASVTVYVPGERLVKLPVRVTVVPLAPPLRVIELPPGVSEKVKLPLPPSTCFVTTIAPFAAFVKAGRHGVAPAPVTTAIHVVAPTGTKSGFVPSVTVYVPCGRPANVAVPLPATVVPVVVIVA
ncbi:MAG: hypothetical protein E6I20_14615, partial [Chloroflexi bacterium]